MSEIGVKISELPKIQQLQMATEIEVRDTAEPNVNLQNKKATFQQVLSLIAGGIPLPPSGVEWVTPPVITITGTQVSVTAAEADFDGDYVQYSAGTVANVTLPLSGLKRIDALAGRADGTYAYVVGTASVTPATPAIPAGSLFVSFLLWTPEGGSEKEPETGGVSLEEVQALLQGYLPLVFERYEHVEVGDHEFYMTAQGINTAGNDTLGYLYLDKSGPGMGGQFTHGGQSYGYGIEGTWPDWYLKMGSLRVGFFEQGGQMVPALKNGNHLLHLGADGIVYLNGVEFTAGGGGSGATTFDALTDTPSSKQANKWLKVNAGGTALEYADAPGGSDTTRENTYAALTLASTVTWNVGTAIKEGKRTLTIPSGWSGTFINFSVSNISAGFTGILAVYNNDIVSHAVRLPTGSNYAVASGETSSINVAAGGVVELNIAFDGVKIKVARSSFQAI